MAKPTREMIEKTARNYFAAEYAAKGEKFATAEEFASMQRDPLAYYGNAWGVGIVTEVCDVAHGYRITGNGGDSDRFTKLTKAELARAAERVRAAQAAAAPARTFYVVCIEDGVGAAGLCEASAYATREEAAAAAADLREQYGRHGNRFEVRDSLEGVALIIDVLTSYSDAQAAEIMAAADMTIPGNKRACEYMAQHYPATAPGATLKGRNFAPLWRSVLNGRMTLADVAAEVGFWNEYQCAQRFGLFVQRLVTRGRLDAFRAKPDATYMRPLKLDPNAYTKEPGKPWAVFGGAILLAHYATREEAEAFAAAARPDWEARLGGKVTVAEQAPGERRRLAPQWRSLVPLYLTAIQHGTDKARDAASAELRTMALAADRWNALCDCRPMGGDDDGSAPALVYNLAAALDNLERFASGFEDDPSQGELAADLKAARDALEACNVAFPLHREPAAV